MSELQKVTEFEALLQRAESAESRVKELEARIERVQNAARNYTGQEPSASVLFRSIDEASYHCKTFGQYCFPDQKCPACGGYND